MDQLLKISVMTILKHSLKHPFSLKVLSLIFFCYRHPTLQKSTNGGICNGNVAGNKQYLPKLNGITHNAQNGIPNR